MTWCAVAGSAESRNVRPGHASSGLCAVYGPGRRPRRHAMPRSRATRRKSSTAIQQQRRHLLVAAQRDAVVGLPGAQVSINYRYLDCWERDFGIYISDTSGFGCDCGSSRQKVKVKKVGRGAFCAFRVPVYRSLLLSAPIELLVLVVAIVAAAVVAAAAVVT